MRGANLGSGQDRPSCIVPELGQVSEDNADISINKDSWGVFHEDELGSNNTGASQDLPIKAGARAVDSFAVAGNANILAREPRMEAIHAAGVFGDGSNSLASPSCTRSPGNHPSAARDRRMAQA
jgi:hypothetical protein